MKSVYVLIILAAFIGGAAAGYQWRNQRAYLEQVQREKDYTTALAQAQHQARQREHLLQKEMDVLTHDAQKQLDAVIHLERAAADSRVRELAQQYAAGYRTGNTSTATSGCHAERKRAGMLAELLTELDELAAVFATEADRNRISGKACEAAYAAISD